MASTDLRALVAWGFASPPIVGGLAGLAAATYAEVAGGGPGAVNLLVFALAPAGSIVGVGAGVIAGLATRALGARIPLVLVAIVASIAGWLISGSLACAILLRDQQQWEPYVVISVLVLSGVVTTIGFLSARVGSRRREPNHDGS